MSSNKQNTLKNIIAMAVVVAYRITLHTEIFPGIRNWVYRQVFVGGGGYKHAQSTDFH